MKKIIDWHKEQIFWFMAKFNLGLYEVAWIAWFKGLLIGGLLLLLCSCGSYQLSTLNHNKTNYFVSVPDDVKIDTLSYSQFKWKLRTDFNFRWDFAQYAMNQPYSWYFNNFRYNYWRPYNSFDMYWNSYSYWTDWAYNYPYYWGYSSWHNPWRHYYWHRPYNYWSNSWYNGPWHNSGYNIVWNASRENNIAFIYGRRGSRSIESKNIQNTISRRYNNPRNNVQNSNLNNIVNELREHYNIKPRVYSNPNNINNNTRPSFNNNSKPSYNNNVRPSYNNNSNNYISRPSINSSSSNSNSIRSSNNSSRGGINKGRN